MYKTQQEDAFQELRGSPHENQTMLVYGWFSDF